MTIEKHEPTQMGASFPVYRKMRSRVLLALLAGQAAKDGMGLNG